MSWPEHWSEFCIRHPMLGAITVSIGPFASVVMDAYHGMAIIAGIQGFVTVALFSCVWRAFNIMRKSRVNQVLDRLKS